MVYKALALQQANLGSIPGFGMVPRVLPEVNPEIEE